MADDMSAADVAVLSRGGYGYGGGYGDGFGFGGGGLWLFAILALMWGGNGFFGGNGFAGAGNLATQNDVQRGFDALNLENQGRDIMNAVTNGTAQSVAATNQMFHDTLSVIADKYNETTRDIGAVQIAQANALANQNQCCCETKLLLTEQNAATNANIAQSRYDAALNTAAINANTTTQIQKILDTLAQNKIEALQGRIQQLELQAATGNTVKYPTTMSYTAGFSPFCGCGYNGLFA